MKIHLTCFSDPRMTISQQRLIASAKQFGVDECHVWRETDLPKWFNDYFADVLREEKGYGLYCWKPTIVFETQLNLKDGDILIYADAGQEFIAPVQHVINEMKEDIFLFTNCWPHQDWCKMDLMQEVNGGATGAAPQVQASLMFFRVSNHSRQLLEEWAMRTLKISNIDNSPSKLPNVPTFAETRWDQSIISSIAIRDKIKMNWFPSTTFMNKRNEFDNKYPAIVEHHRKRDSEWA